MIIIHRVLSTEKSWDKERARSSCEMSMGILLLGSLTSSYEFAHQFDYLILPFCLMTCKSISTRQAEKSVCTKFSLIPQTFSTCKTSLNHCFGAWKLRTEKKSFANSPGVSLKLFVIRSWFVDLNQEALPQFNKQVTAPNRNRKSQKSGRKLGSEDAE